MKTAIIIIAELVRSLVLSGLAAAGIMLAVVVAASASGYCLWKLWARARR